MKSSTAVAERKQGTEVELVDLGEEAGAGLEGLSVNEQLTPFLRVLQPLSPQVDKRAAEYVPGAEGGMFYDTAAQEVFDGELGLQVIVCARDYHYGLWLPRDTGGGFRGMLPPDHPAIKTLIARHGRFKLPRFRDGRWSAEPYEHEGEKVEVVETIQLYLLYAPEEVNEMTARRAIAAFTSTALPVAQGYLTRHNNWRFRTAQGMSPAALWSYRWRATTVQQENAKGKWYNWKLDLEPRGAKPIEALIPRTEPIYAMAKEFHESYRAGIVKPDYEAGASAGAAVDEDLPF